MLSGKRHGCKLSASTTGYPECNPIHSDLEKRSKGGTSQQDNTGITGAISIR